MRTRRTGLAGASNAAQAGEPAIRVSRRGRFRERLEDQASAVGLAEHALFGEALAVGGEGVCAKKIVAVSTEPEFPEALVSQALGLADRIGLEVVGLSIGPAEAGGPEGQASRRGEFFRERAMRSGRDFAERALQAGIPFRHVVGFGRVGEVLERESSRLKRVEFVLAVREQRGRDGYRPSMPLYEVTG
ncbi:hypothetical protein NNJEOMEG_02441 [Fundidesulfovibrio magnetotacticus]|uniref:UspA domain-containing protein n=1 Tax=Fundidesulfovibrio magnetotacticus TaxID=2730080 RepID=A0A6V8LS79_9BACT|nr:hypothetical protein [Fundidesulfovibrio magnetotacticus]GFK94594.1 hypothetical protein NNJEOMEG_02441 [Fundidesulfovibrio magnetotacticus]